MIWFEQSAALDPNPAALHSLNCVNLCCFLGGNLPFLESLFANAACSVGSVSSKKEVRGAMKAEGSLRACS